MRVTVPAIVGVLVTSSAFGQTEGLPPLPPPPPSSEPPASTPPAPGAPPAAATPPSPPPASTAPPGTPPGSSSPGSTASAPCVPCDASHGPGAYLHDGLYLRMAVGGSYGWIAGQGPSGPAHVSGAAPMFLFAIGGTPAPGLVLAVTLMGTGASGALAGAPPGAAGNASVTQPLLGALVDWYPRPDDGFHVSGAVGLGGVDMTTANGVDSSSLSAGFRVMTGSAYWIGPQWSFGLDAVVTTALPSTTQTDDNSGTSYKLTPATVGFAVSALLH